MEWIEKFVIWVLVVGAVICFVVSGYGGWLAFSMSSNEVLGRALVWLSAALVFMMGVMFLFLTLEAYEGRERAPTRKAKIGEDSYY